MGNNLKWILCWVAYCAISVCFWTEAFSHNSHGQWPAFDVADKSIQDWAAGLKSSQGSCCSGADGYPAEAEWDMDTGHYRVKIEGQWVDVPDDRVIREPNRFGYAVVWWYRIWAGEGQVPEIRCFIPGGGA